MVEKLTRKVKEVHDKYQKSGGRAKKNNEGYRNDGTEKTTSSYKRNIEWASVFYLSHTDRKKCD